MIKNKFSKLNELGSLMVEAMAMLALISMVTPILYKKAAERTTELQDINAASQVRGLIKSVDDYVKDNYDKIVSGGKIKNSSGDEQSYSGLSGTNAKITVPLTHFSDYLPYGFLTSAGAVQETKTFGADYKVVLKKIDATIDGKTKKTITAFLVTTPKEGDKFPMLRASRIASMIGSNGGYAEKKGGKVIANGVQGIWSIADMNTELGVTATNGAVMASSVQPIVAAGGGGDSDNYLYRNFRAGKPELNQMETDLYMGGIGGSIDKNIRNVNQMIITANQPAHMADDAKGIAGALYIKGGGGAYVEGTLGAMMASATPFTVDSTGVKYGNLFSVTPTNLMYGDAGNVIKASATDLNLLNGKIVVDAAGTRINSQTNIAGGTVIGDLTGGVNSTDGNPNKLTVKGDADVTGILTAGELRTAKFKTLTLDAGAANYGGPWNLHVETTKASLSQADFTVGGDKLNIKPTTTEMNNASITLNANEIGKLVLNTSGANLSATNNVFVHGNNSANLYSGTVAPSTVANEASIQGNMFRVNTNGAINSIVDSFTIKDAGATKLAQADITGSVYRVRNMNLQVENPASASVFTVNPRTTGSETIDANVQDFDVKSSGIVIDSTTSNANRNFAAKNGGAATTTGYTYIGRGRLDIKDTANAKVLVVDANNTDKAVADRGSVYIRKGIVELESGYASEISDATVTGMTPVAANDKGYVRADRFISNRAYINPIVSGIPGGFTTRGTVYDTYQVNPAYTSVMHDIKLTSRGGARLSDILPDFINKGIYVVDNTYKESVGSWEKVDGCPAFTSGTSCQTVSAANTAVNHTDWTSPWLGVVPAPSCPPGYAKVVTIMPAGFAMSQAGVPGTRVTGKKQDIVILNYPKNPNADYTANPADKPSPLYFQKSTWLRAKVYTHGSDDNFKGWSAIMGFMYPYTYYKKYMDELKAQGVLSFTPSNDAIAWNLFPVFRKQLEAYATVYCYFDRKGNMGTKFSTDLIDTTYDQLANFRKPMSGKPSSAVGNDSGYFNRLNDPNLKYTEPW